MISTARLTRRFGCVRKRGPRPAHFSEGSCLEAVNEPPATLRNSKRLRRRPDRQLPWKFKERIASAFDDIDLEPADLDDGEVQLIDLYPFHHGRRLVGRQGSSQRGKPRIIIVAPTGSGKTVIGSTIVKNAIAINRKVLVLADSCVLHQRGRHRGSSHQHGVGHGVVQAGFRAAAGPAGAGRVDPDVQCPRAPDQHHRADRTPIS